ncbi:MAG: TM2 domain-containing protein [Kiritimatiellae bacterium]|nr:TM2 domain-containing protein [Kiritimatiellia bacterium]
MGCGCDPRKGNKYCPNCGVEIATEQIVCVECGYALNVQKTVVQQQDGTAKNKTTFLVLGILLGEFGVHNFYAGYTAKGILQLCLTVLSCGILAFVSWIWGIIEAVTVDKDASGVPFSK